MSKPEEIILIRYCSHCLLPDTKPDLYFDDSGKCAACIAFDERPNIDWSRREKEFSDVLKHYSKLSKSQWDCVVPVSGGKDSTIQVLKILELGFTPLCVISSTCHLSQIGRLNIDNLRQLGVDLIEFSPNPIVRRRLNRIGLETVGDIAWPEHLGIFTIPVKAAVLYKTPLIVWGENSQNEYGGPSGSQENKYLDRNWLEEFGGLLGLRVSDLESVYGFTPKELAMYQYPSKEDLEECQVTGVFMGQYFPWDGMANYFLAQANGFKSFGSPIEGSAVDYENLDNLQHGIHDYFKFLKFGFGRATDLVSINIRRGRLTRAQGLEIVKQRDGKYPDTYLGIELSEILRPLSLSVKDFDEICLRFTNPDIFVRNESGEYLRSGKDLIKVNYDNAD